MSIYNVARQLTSTAKLSEPHVLRPGQIVQGKILKLYPNNKAQIQLGSQKMTAQLEASLTTGGQYHFQVQAIDDVVRLKVLGEQVLNQLQENVQNIMQQLGLKTTVLLMQELIKEKIPFRKDQLVKAFQLLEEAKNKLQAQEVLKEMIARKRPVTATVFNALYTKRTSGFTEQIQSLLKQFNLSETARYRNIRNQLQQMVNQPLQSKAELIKRIITEATNNNQQFFNLLKATGMIESSLDFTSWKSQVSAYAEQNNLKRLNISNHDVSALELPLKLKETEVRQKLEQVVDNKAKLSHEAQKLMQKFGKEIHETVINNSPLDAKEFALLKQQIIKKLLPLLAKTKQNTITNRLQNTPTAIRQLSQNLQTLVDRQTYQTEVQFLKHMKQSEAFLTMTPKEQFLTHLKQVLLFTGLTYENLVKQDLVQQQSETVKSMLIQMIQQHDGINLERAQQLLHFINGLQMQSVNETSNFIQAGLQIPGGKLSLNNDLRLDIEGEKTENGMVNPDHCRILFYLDLKNLKETIIDMHIQKRTVAVTIFNDEERLETDSHFLQPMLKEGLATLDYHLTTVTIKSLQQVDKPAKKQMSPINQQSYQGVDYRI